MRLLLLLSVVIRTVAADPGEAKLRLDAESLEDRRARVHAIYEQARGESAQEYWRASLDDQKLNLQIGAHEELGPVRTDVSIEQEWQESLETRKAQMALSVPVQGWELGVRSQLGWQAADDDPWEVQPTQLGGWVKTPEWRGFRAQASWDKVDQTETSKLALLRKGQKRLEAEVSHGPGFECLTGRFHQPLSKRSTLSLEAEQRQSDYWQRRWLARYQWKLNSSTRFSAQGSRRWSEREAEWEDKVEAMMELRF